jgi:hypothetical protein
MPMQPSTQVTHMPLKGTMEFSVRFLVSVAADAFIFVNAAIFILLSLVQRKHPTN